MPTTAVKNTSGSYDIYQGGLKISTGTLDYAKSQGATIAPEAPAVTAAATNAGATPNQAAAITQAVQTGNTNKVGVPSNIRDILGVGNAIIPTPTTPIPATALSQNSDIQSILSSALKGNDPSSTIAGLLSLYGASSAEQDKVNSLNDTLTKLITASGGQASDIQSALTAQGVPESQQQLSQLNLDVARQKGALDAFDAETARGLDNITKQPITAGAVGNEQAKYQRDRDLTKLAMTAELNANVALAQAYQGNIDLGTKLAQQAVDLKYAPILNQIDVVKQQLSAAQSTLSSADSKRATIITGLINLQQDQITQQKAEDSKKEALVVQAAANGAPLSVINSMRAAADSVSAAQVGSTWIKGNLESTSGSGGALSNSDISTGAAKAGVSIDSFKALNQDVQNFFANNTKGVTAYNGLLDDLHQGNVSLADAQDQINTSVTLSQPVKDYLLQQLQAAAPQGGGGGFWGGVGSFFGGAWDAVKNTIGL